MNIKILADSACDLSQHQYDELNIEMVSQNVNISGVEYKDGLTITPKTIYDAMRAGKQPKTSQAIPHAFKSSFMTCAETNQPLIYISLSDALSGTYASAKSMEKEVRETYPNAPIHIIDSKGVTLGYGLIVIRAAQLAKEGASVEKVIEIANYHINHMEHIFTVDDLEYLYRSGRLSKTASVIGSLLRIKPILHIADGKLVPLEKIRGSNKVLNRMIEIAEKRGTDFENQLIGISHGDDIETAEKLKTMIKDRLGAKQFITEMVGSSVGVHSGPGTIAMFFLNKPYK